MALATFGNIGVDMVNFHIGELVLGTYVVKTPTLLSVDLLNGEIATFIGTGFQYDAMGNPVAGTVTQVAETYFGQKVFDISGFSVPATTFFTWALTDNTVGAIGTIFRGPDTFVGSNGSDYFHSFTGNDTIDGGPGNDTIAGSDGEDYLRGGDGADLIVGGNDHDDINGNKGNDNLGGGEGDDWVVGGQDEDFLTGDNGNDIVYGNLGNDIVLGGNGNDWVRGGQGNDVVEGGDGADWLWGDRGTDTLTGGAGADIFHSFSGAGIDRITDFSYAQGDRVILDDRTAYTVTQIGADAVITIGGVDQVILVGVTASSLSSDVISYA